MGKIVKLKNKKTGVKVYPVTATSAVVDANSGERLNDALKNKVEEAPMDGAQYVRKNGGWAVAEVSMDANEICRINLKSNQGDADNASLNGATVNVVNTVTGDVIYNGTWNGSEIQLSIPGATTYKVTVGDVADYKTPDAITIEATAFSSRDLILTYQTEVVSVTLSSDNGVSVVGQKVTINGREYTWNGSVISQKVAFGVSYSISLSTKEGYITPEPLSYTANQTSRNLSVIYYVMPGTLTPSLGVYIQDTLGYYFTVEEWNNNLGRTPNCVAVFTELCKFAIALSYVSWGQLSWGGMGSLISGVTTTSNVGDAVQDFKGYDNTQAICNELGSSAVAAYQCSIYEFPNGEKGYLGSAGEWKAVLDNKTLISSALSKCGGTSLHNYHFTSTQYDADNHWGIGLNDINSLFAIEKDYWQQGSLRAFAKL